MIAALALQLSFPPKLDEQFVERKCRATLCTYRESATVVEAHETRCPFLALDDSIRLLLSSVVTLEQHRLDQRSLIEAQQATIARQQSAIEALQAALSAQAVSIQSLSDTQRSHS